MKGQLMTNLERPDFIMQVGAYMARNGWKETARVYLQRAGEMATKDRDFEIQYSIGEYFHNVEEVRRKLAPSFHVMQLTSCSPLCAAEREAGGGVLHERGYTGAQCHLGAGIGRS